MRAAPHPSDFETMSRSARKNGGSPSSGVIAKYDAHHTVLEKTYGALADLRRELADSRAAVLERTELLKSFADCQDPQRAWLLLEDYFGKLSLARKDFSSHDWWPRLLAVHGAARLEELALLFLRAGRPLPTEMAPYANFERLAQVEELEQEQRFIQELERWLFPEAPSHLDAAKAALRVGCCMQPHPEQSRMHWLEVQLGLHRPRTGEKLRTLQEIIELTTRAAHEQELFTPEDWSFIQWLAESYGAKAEISEPLRLSGLGLLQWLARWGNTGRLQLLPDQAPLKFIGEIADFVPCLEPAREELAFTQQVRLGNGQLRSLQDIFFFAGEPILALDQGTFYLLRQAPASGLLNTWLERKKLPVRKLSHRFLARLRRTETIQRTDWDKICVAHPARPQFVFELAEDTVRLRLLAQSERDHSLWSFNGHEWQKVQGTPPAEGKPEFLDDQRLEPAAQWLRRLDWFTPEPGLWVGDANEGFLNGLAANWPHRPAEAEYLGNPAFHRLFLAPRRFKPRLLVQGSGIDWFSVSAEWEQEGLKLTRADLERLANASSRFVKLPDGGWIELDLEAVQSAQEALADFGLEGLSPMPHRVDLAQAAFLGEAALERFGDTAPAKALRRQVSQFTGIPITPLPKEVQAELRPYQREGFNFLCHLTAMKMGGILADDMGLGKTLQTLTWLCWLKTRPESNNKPALVICPASVLQNWKREANRFTPHLKVLVLESGAARHNLRQQIPEYDLIVTNYALLRRDLPELQKFEFETIILDEAQFIKNPSAQVTQCVKQLLASQRLALTGTPLENRLLDLWSIMDFIQPGILGSQTDFVQKYEVRGGDAPTQSVARRRLAARLRPFLLRRLKQQVAQDLPERIEERMDCVLDEPQRKLYLAELKRSREEVFNNVAEKGVAKSKIHVLAALTRLRQICCHPRLVGNDSASGKTDTLFEVLDPLLAEGQKVLVFSQFVQMLKILEQECQQRQIPTHLLIGATKERQAVVQAFQGDSQPGVFLLSLRAAGTGLNLTAASYVVLYDPWWNPAVEAQAIDRSHRIGQTRTVIAYRLIAPGTVEEKIWNLQQQKAQTIKDVLGEEGFARSLTKNDLEYLFAED